MQLSKNDLLRTQAYVDGAWTDADSGALTSVTNPANGAVVAEVARCSKAETRRAIFAAERPRPIGAAVRPGKGRTRCAVYLLR